MSNIGQLQVSFAWVTTAFPALPANLSDLHQHSFLGHVKCLSWTTFSSAPHLHCKTQASGAALAWETAGLMAGGKDQMALHVLYSRLVLGCGIHHVCSRSLPKQATRPNLM